MVERSHLHHGLYGLRWKSSSGRIEGNTISANYIEVTPLLFYMEGPFQLDNISIVNNTLPQCAVDVGVAQAALAHCTRASARSRCLRHHMHVFGPRALLQHRQAQALVHRLQLGPRHWSAHGGAHGALLNVSGRAAAEPRRA